MTWVEVLPALGITAVLGLSLIECVKFLKRTDYRGMMDARVPYTEYKARVDVDGRLAERDERLGLHPTEVEWIHPLWRPKTYPEQH